MRTEEQIRRRLDDLEARYDQNDPPSSPTADELEVELLRAMAELEWVLGEREDPQDLPPEA